MARGMARGMPAAKDGSGKIRQRHTQSEPNLTRISPYLPAFPCLQDVGGPSKPWVTPRRGRFHPRLGVTHALSRGSGRNRKDKKKLFLSFSSYGLVSLWLPHALPAAPTRISAPAGSDPPRKYRAVQPCSRVCAPCPSPTPRPTLGAHPHLYFLPQGLRPCGPAARSNHIEHSEHSGIFPTGVLSDSQWRRHYYVWP